MSRLAAVFGNVRVLVGTGRLDAYIRLNRRREPGALLASTWSAAGRLGILFKGGALYRNRFGYDWRSILFLRIVKRLDRASIPCCRRYRSATSRRCGLWRMAAGRLSW